VKLSELDLLEMPGLLIGWMNDAWSGDSKIVAFLAFACLVVITSAISLQCIRWFLDGFVSVVTSLKKTWPSFNRIQREKI